MIPGTTLPASNEKKKRSCRCRRGIEKVMRHNRLHRMPTFAFGPILSFVATAAVRILVVRVAAEESESASSETCGNNDNSECTNVCIDGRCMCNPMWGHTGADCSEMTWNSWGVVAVLVLVIPYSIHVLHAAAKRGLSSSSKTWSGFAELASIFFRVKRENGEISEIDHASIHKKYVRFGGGF